MRWLPRTAQRSPTEDGPEPLQRSASTPRPTRLLIGSANPGKVAEYRRLLAGLDLELLSPDQLDPVPPEPPETGESFAENAMAKARAYAEATGLASVADDSGLLVEALRGAPGVRSRRFFGPDTTAEERNTRLLSLLQGASDRRARFVCLVALAVPPADERGARSNPGGAAPTIELFGGEVHGEIADGPRGEQGFGYDPIFVITADRRTMAELGPEEKDRISHRGLAVAKLRTYVGIGTPPARPAAQPRSDATMVGPAPNAPRADASVVGPVPSAPGGERTVVDVHVPPSPARSAQTASSAPTVPSAPERLDVTAPTIRVPARPRIRLSITKGGSGNPIELVEREYTIGRSARSDVVLEDPSVSGQHAKLAPHAEGFTLSDLGSTNGTKVNGKPVQGEQVLRAGDTIGIGDAVLRYERLA